MSHRDGHVFKGKFKDWRKDGEGKMTYRNGDIYTGVWDGDSGKGLIVYTDGSSYEVSSPQGRGMLPGAQGEFLKDRKHGQGTYTLPSGNSYTGSYKVKAYLCWRPHLTQDDIENGNGTFIWTDGYKYVVRDRNMLTC
jgi:hypothetical protein